MPNAEGQGAEGRDGRLLSDAEVAIIRRWTERDLTIAQRQDQTALYEARGDLRVALLGHIEAQAARIAEVKARVTMFERLIEVCSERNEVIPKSVLLVGNRAPTEKEIAHARELAVKYGWHGNDALPVTTESE